MTCADGSRAFPAYRLASRLANEVGKFVKHLVRLRRLFLPMLSDELGATAMFEYLENTDGTDKDRRAGIDRHMARWLRITPALGTS
jgi:hypothetical protein